MMDAEHQKRLTIQEGAIDGFKVQQVRPHLRGHSIYLCVSKCVSIWVPTGCIP